MKRYLFILAILFIANNVYSQYKIDNHDEKRTCITIGFLQGGGSLIGADIEFLVTKRIGFQLGGGIIGFGTGINYHFKPTIRSSFLSLQYWNQGIGDSFAQNAIGAVFVFRGKKWFTFTGGLGLPIEKGPAMDEDYVQPPVMLLYAIGVYI